MTNFAHRKLKKGVKNLTEKEHHVSEQITRDFCQNTVPTESLCPRGPYAKTLFLQSSHYYSF
jgi:hypothetical protein